MIAFLLAAVAPLLQEPNARWASLSHQVEDGVLTIEIRDFEAHFESKRMAAGNMILHLDHARYLEEIKNERPPMDPEIETPKMVAGWYPQLLQSLGLPPQDNLLLRAEMKRGIVLMDAETGLFAESLLFTHKEGLTTVLHADLRFPKNTGPKGWPLRIVCAQLQEFQNGRIHIEGAELTTCDAGIPHYSIGLEQLVGIPRKDRSWSWEPSSAYLSLASIRMFPLPAPNFDTSGLNVDGFLGFQGIRLDSGNRLGQSIGFEIGSGGGREDDSLSWSWQVSPSISSRRGLPISGRALFEGQGPVPFQSSWGLFALQDQAPDTHPFAKKVVRASDTRWALEGHTRFQLANDWRLDLDLRAAADPLLAPEFFQSEWRTQKDSLSEIYLHHEKENEVFSAHVEGVVDGAGFAPLTGYSGGVFPQFQESLPVLRWESLPKTVSQWGAPWEEGTTVVPLNFSGGLELGSYRFRSVQLDAPWGTPGLSVLEDVHRHRVHGFAEIAAPLHLAGWTIRPAMRVDAIGHNQDASGSANSGHALGESSLEISTLLSRSYQDGWEHRILPQIRWRDRSLLAKDGGELIGFTSWDTAGPGTVVETSLRQLFLPPNSSQAWADLDFRLPFYPDPSDPLVDPIFPHVREQATDGSWGPAELQLAWRPGAAHPDFAAIRVDGRLRHSGKGGFDELYARVGIHANQDLSWGLQLFKVQDLFSFAQGWTDWRMTDALGVHIALPWAFEDASVGRSELSLRWYAHDFVLEMGARRDQSLGETGVFFGFQPRFLVDSAPR